MTYDVIDNDIALLNVYFGESTVMGKYLSLGKFLVTQIQSMNEA